MQIRPEQVKNLMRGAFINQDLLNKNLLREVPSGVFDGINRAFNLQRLIDPALALVFYNGNLQKAGDHYNLMGQLLTLGEAPLPGDVLEVLYPPPVGYTG